MILNSKKNMLNLDIRGVEMELTEGIVGAIEAKLASLDKYLESVGTPRELRVDAGVSTHHHNKGEIFRAVANLSIPGHKIRVEEEGEDLYGAIDGLKDKLKAEIIKITKSHVDEKRAGGREAKEEGTETELL
jgi:ribosomal subunit interface protein